MTTLRRYWDYELLAVIAVGWALHQLGTGAEGKAAVLVLYLLFAVMLACAWGALTRLGETT